MENFGINIPMEKMVRFCDKWSIKELALFGSALREDFRDQSDIDVLVTFKPEAKHTLFHLVRMQTELSEMFGREVDVVSRRGIEASRNHLRKNEILTTAKTIYVA
jgi:uncharacterized protein